MTTSRYLLNCWQAAAYGREVGAALFPRRLLDEAVLLFRDSGGTVQAIADKCAHRGLPLSRGRLHGDIVQCGYHGMQFDGSGTCLGVPGQDHIPAGAVVRAYPVIEQHGFVWIWMGDPDASARAAIPDMFWFDDPAWTCVSGYHNVGADYRLLNDNLLDLSHESFVHVETIGNEAVADSPVSAEIVDDTVRVSRYMNACEPPPFYKRVTGFNEKIDRWHTTIYTPPGVLVIENGSMPTGADRDAAKERRVINLITPETATSSHYFWGVARQYERDDATLSNFLLNATSETFDQDKDLLEAQQRSLGPEPVEAFAVKIKVDAGPILGRRLLEQHIAAERERSPAHV
jgi:phenylpropionate dioxygenase-like ring-hydroxylating dioxygenase large terminal subunit